MGAKILIAGGALVAFACAIFLAPLLLFTSPTDAAAADCSPYKASKSAAVNMAVARIAYETATGKGSRPRAVLALFEAGLAESGFRNLANSTVPSSLRLPHDGVGSNGSSVGFLQQQVGTDGTGRGWAWGPVTAAMNPRTATLSFLAVADPIDHASAPSEDAATLAQSVQASAVADGSNYRAQRAAAVSLLTKLGDSKATAVGGCTFSPDGTLKDPGYGPQDCQATGVAHCLRPRALNIYNLVRTRANCGTIKPPVCVHGYEGWRPSDPVPDHPDGRAIDLNIADPMGQTPANDQTAFGWQLARWLQTNARTLHIDYIIWQARIWSTARSSEGWRDYCATGSCGPYGATTNPTALHMDHIHVSVK